MEGQSAGPAARRRGMLGIYSAAGAGLLLVVGVCAAWTPVKVWYYERCFHGFRANPWYYARKMTECGPGGTRRLLQVPKGEPIEEEGAEDVAIALKKYSRHDVLPTLNALFADPDPTTRALAAAVAGYLRDERCLAELRRLAQDKTPLPAGALPATVGVWAEHAIRRITVPETPAEAAARADREALVEYESAGPPRFKGMTKRR